MPRPAGRSGWVSTSGTLNPAASSRARAVRANSGVPAKTTRIRPQSRFGALMNSMPCWVRRTTLPESRYTQKNMSLPSFQR
jgi:hypothetical protein